MKAERHSATGANMSTRAVIAVIKRAEEIIRGEAASWKENVFGNGHWSQDELDQPIIEEYATFMAIAEDLGFAAAILRQQDDLEAATIAANGEPEEGEEEAP